MLSLIASFYGKVYANKGSGKQWGEEGGTRASSPPLFCQQHPWQIAKFFLTHLLFKSSHPKIKYVRIVQPIKLIGYVFIPWIILPKSIWTIWGIPLALIFFWFSPPFLGVYDIEFDALKVLPNQWLHLDNDKNTVFYHIAKEKKERN